MPRLGDGPRDTPGLRWRGCDSKSSVVADGSVAGEIEVGTEDISTPRR